MEVLNELLFTALSKNFYEGFNADFIYDLNLKKDNKKMTDKQATALKKIYDKFKLETKLKYFRDLNAEVIMLDTIEPLDQPCENCNCEFVLGFIEVKDKLLCVDCFNTEFTNPLPTEVKKRVFKKKVQNT
jgi:hypothetical protein